METSNASPRYSTGIAPSDVPRALPPDDLDAAAAQCMLQPAASVAFVGMSPNSMPSATMVCAIWGRTPEIVHSAPIRRAATTVFSRC